MTWVIIILLVVIVLLVAIGTVRQGKVADLETEILVLKEERDSLVTKVNLLERKIKDIRSAYEEVNNIEEQKKENKKNRKEPPPSGDVSSRLDRLNGLSDKRS